MITKTFLLSVCVMFLFVCVSCASGKEAKVGEEFTLKSKESVSIKETGIDITLDEIGREWLANGKGESVYCRVTVKNKSGATKSTMGFGRPVFIGEYAVQLVRANPFGNGDATFVVKEKKDVQIADNKQEENSPQNKTATAFLSKYNLTIESQYKESTITFPKTLTGLPYTHYQSASSAAGFDLSPYKEKTLVLQTYKLKEKTKRGSNLFAHLVFDKGKVVGVWMSTDAPVAPGIVSIKTKPSDLSW